MQYIFPWLDLLWIPLALLVLPKMQWLESCAVIICSAIMLRLQVEMFDGFGYSNGVFGFLPYDIFIKGMVAYSLIIALYMIAILILNQYRWRAHIVLSLSVFFNASIFSAIIMAL